VDDDLRGKEKEVVIVYVKVLPQHLPGSTDEIDGYCKSG
jgi:hypothetical protein